MVNHYITYKNEKNNLVTFYLNIVTEYSFGKSNSIIVKESAKGGKAIVINNGALQEDIPFTGTLFAVAYNSNSNSASLFNGFDDLNKAINELKRVRTSGIIVDFISPFYKKGSNKYYIKSLYFTTLNDNNSIDFVLNLTEDRKYNVTFAENNYSERKNYTAKLIDEARDREQRIRDETPIEEIRAEVKFHDNIQEQNFNEALDYMLGLDNKKIEKEIESITKDIKSGKISEDLGRKRIDDLYKALRVRDTPQFAIENQYFLGQVQATTLTYSKPYISLDNLELNIDLDKVKANNNTTYVKGGNKPPLPMTN